MKKDSFAKALSYAHRLLSLRERTAKEVERRLKEKGYGGECARQVLQRLSEKRFIDDRRFAREWIKNSSALRPTGIFAIKSELKRKGLEEGLINDAFDDDEVGYNEREVAGSLAEKLLESTRETDRLRRKKKVHGYLARRGFSFDVINDITDCI